MIIDQENDIDRKFSASKTDVTSKIDEVIMAEKRKKGKNSKKK